MPSIPSRTRAVSLAALIASAALAGPAARADQVSMIPAKDNTLIEDPNGALSNGAGPGIFAGRTSQSTGSVRRAVIAFDIAAHVPGGSTITAVTLALGMTDTNAGTVPVSLHRVVADWGEGASSTPGGKGAPSTSGDATWIHRFYDTDLWASPGGDFVAFASAAVDVDQIGIYTWGSTPEMVADVQSWLDAPAGNFGWILIGDESTGTTVKRFDSREADPNLSDLPVLIVEYERPCMNPTYVGPGYWNRQCLGVPKDAGGLKPGKGRGPNAPTEPGFADVLMPCADTMLADLGFAATTCEGIDPRPRSDRCEKALRKLTTLVLNVCSGRLQESCPVSVSEAGCVSTTVGALIDELAALVIARECRVALRCGGNPE
jgi:hypothetical protein